MLMCACVCAQAAAQWLEEQTQPYGEDRDRHRRVADTRCCGGHPATTATTATGIPSLSTSCAVGSGGAGFLYNGNVPSR